MSALGVVLTVIVTIAVVVFILLFERQRAERIERDLRDDAARRTRDDEGPS